MRVLFRDVRCHRGDACVMARVPVCVHYMLPATCTICFSLFLVRVSGLPRSSSPEGVTQQRNRSTSITLKGKLYLNLVAQQAHTNVSFPNSFKKTEPLKKMPLFCLSFDTMVLRIAGGLKMQRTCERNKRINKYITSSPVLPFSVLL